MPVEVQLTSGRTIMLKELRQFSFYEGLLEGLPTTKSNREGIERLLNETKEQYHWCNVLLIPPVETPIPDDPADPYPFGTPASIPQIGCVARFTSLSPAKDQSMDYSELVVIWFQKDFSFLGAEDQTSLLGSIDWDRHALDREW